MRRISSVSCGVSLAGSLVVGQQAPPSFRGGVTLVTIDVTVLDREGSVMLKLTFGTAGQPGVERIVSPVNDNGTFRSDAQFPLDRVAAGVYAPGNGNRRRQRGRSDVGNDPQAMTVAKAGTDGPAPEATPTCEGSDPGLTPV
jgi:hypothetical protein